MKASSEKRSVLLSLVSNPLLTAITVGLLTSLIAPYIIERTKEKSSLIQQEKEKQDKIIQTQFEIVEKLNSLLWNYRTGAVFIVMDFMNGESNRDIIDKHLKSYDQVSEMTDKELVSEAFRVRMYFSDPELGDKVSSIWNKVAFLDGDIVSQLNSQKYLPRSKSESQDPIWVEIKGKLDEMTAEMSSVLNELFMKIGKKPTSVSDASNNALNTDPR